MSSYSTSYFEVTRSPNGSGWLCRRTAKPFESAAAVREEIVRLEALMRPHATSDDALLIDLRAARGRNDGEMEAELAGLRRLFHRHFGFVGNLVNTAVGKLHLERLARQDGLDEQVFRDEARALAWLRQPTRSARRG